MEIGFKMYNLKILKFLYEFHRSLYVLNNSIFAGITETGSFLPSNKVISFKTLSVSDTIILSPELTLESELKLLETSFLKDSDY